MRHGDADLAALITTSVPPCDIGKISIFSAHLAKYSGEARQSENHKPPYQNLLANII